jgi:hypothetical protein
MDTAIAKPPGTMVSDLFGGEHAPASSTHAAAPVIKTVEPQARPAALPVAVAAAPAPVKPYIVEVENGTVRTEARFSPSEVHE